MAADAAQNQEKQLLLEELAKIQTELQAVKHALKDGVAYLGMQGEILQEYFLQLNAKENLKLAAIATQSHDSEVESAAVRGAETIAADKEDGARREEGWRMENGAWKKHSTSTVAAADDCAGKLAEPTVRSEPPARAPPPGPVVPFTRDSLQSVMEHLCAYEGNVKESGQALRALSSLAYADAKRVGEDATVLKQLVRMLRLYPSDANIQVPAVKALCNAAYDQHVCLRYFANPEVVALLTSSAVQCADNKEHGAKVVEAVVRIATVEHRGNADVAAAKAQGPSTLGAIFMSAMENGNTSWRMPVCNVIGQLVTNEVVDHDEMARHFVACGMAARDSTKAAANWMALAACLSQEADEQALGLQAHQRLMAEALIAVGAIRVTLDLMGAHETHDFVQLVGYEAICNLVGTRIKGLEAFADADGVTRVETALRLHGANADLQMKGVKLLSQGLEWPQHIRKKVKYSPSHAVELTKLMMHNHRDNIELQQTALEALTRYLDQVKCVEDVRAESGEFLVKTTMTRHPDSAAVQKLGRRVLDSIGSDRSWAPESKLRPPR
eukprot:gnl/TRDRNA2_/TRDRNA2_44760_c0_seq2.p1 gnl/TRDRNA2_/TRDRNA2_44760_c0~~gnl/TRDRNA2_/TRDRNA2_44760_c0_seq2.p1  ORF type:complete len:555 (+),score=116.32 gnl/TRDRNA2_/TRDRNA2_44760_c0_seq2:67-1731(+)